MAVSALMVACAKQGEAERCSRSNGDDDCQSGLTCVLRGGISSTICCPPAGQETTAECRGEYQQPITDSGGDGARETSVVTDTGTKGELGSSCTYDSECNVPLRCRAGGKCLYECIANRDCEVQYGTSAAPLPFCDTCSDHLCHATDRAEYHLNDAGVCPTGDAGTDAASSDTGADVGDDTATDTAVDDTTTTDSTVGDAADDGG